MATIHLTRRPAWASQPVLSPEDLIPSDAEVYFLWSYIQGSIVIPETRTQLRHAWGMCERHTFIAVAVESAHRHAFLHGPAILYQDLMERAVGALTLPGPLRAIQVSHRLRTTRPCLMCELGYDAHTSTRIELPDYINAGKDLTNIRAFASETETCWRSGVCGVCDGSGAPPLCRVHLREELAEGRGDLAKQKSLVQSIFDHITAYYHSFWWELRDTDTVEDRAALIGAMGWCSGWRPWLWLVRAGENPVLHGS